MKAQDGKGYSFLLLSGGTGTRTELDYPKQFHLLNGHPMLAYAVIAASQVDQVDEIIINAPNGYEDKTRQIAEAYAGGAYTKVVPAGTTRQDSARILCKAAACEKVILHEAARPIVLPQDIRHLIESEFENVSYCSSISFSMCQADTKNRMMLQSINRSTTLNIQLPQKFNRVDLLESHNKAQESGLEYTEDAMLCIEVGGFNVHYLEGKSTNIKVTTFEEFIFAETIIKGVNRND